MSPSAAKRSRDLSKSSRTRRSGNVCSVNPSKYTSWSPCSRMRVLGNGELVFLDLLHGVKVRFEVDAVQFAQVRRDEMPVQKVNHDERSVCGPPVFDLGDFGQCAQRTTNAGGRVQISQPATNATTGRTSSAITAIVAWVTWSRVVSSVARRIRPFLRCQCRAE